MYGAGEPLKATERYDVALSFAGEDRDLASALAHALRRRSIEVFFDEFEKSQLWGKNLYEFLSEVYSSKARFCVMFISEAYTKKAWTKLERQSAQSRALNEDREYILPLRLDDTKVPGILSTVSYVDLRETTIEEVADLICRKLGKLGDADERVRYQGSKDYFRSLGAKIPEQPAHLKIGTIEVVLSFASGNVIEVLRNSGDQEVWLYENGVERSISVSNSLLQARRGHYVSAMEISVGQSLPELIIATMNYSTGRLVLAADIIKYVAAASVGGVAKASKTLEQSGKTSFLRAFGAALTVLVLGVVISDATQVIGILFWVAFVLALAYPHILELGIKGAEKKIQDFITEQFGAARSGL